MMIFMCCGFFLLLVVVTMSLTVMAIVPSMCYTFYQVVVVLFDIISSLITFYWNAVILFVGILRELHRVISPVFNHVMPVLYFYTRDMFHCLRAVATELWRNLHHLALQGEEGFIVMWGAFVACVYVYWNQVAQVVGNNRQEQDRHATRDMNYNNGMPNGQSPTRNRLYPDLSDIDNYLNNNRLDLNDRNQNEHSEDNAINENAGLRRRSGGLNAQFSDQTAHGSDSRSCVVCFDRDRNTAVFPCGHTHTCMQCTLSIVRRNNLCPICQQRIIEHRHIFV